MRGLNPLQSARIIAAGHAFIQNLRCRQYDDMADEPPLARVRAAFDQVALHLSGVRPASPQSRSSPSINAKEPFSCTARGRQVMIAAVWRPAALLLAASQRNCAVRVRADAVRRVGVSSGYGPLD